MSDEDTGPRVIVTFHPQEWVDTSAKPHESGGKQLVPAEQREPLSFTVPWTDGTDDTGAVLEDESYEANQLRDHPNAPDWVNDWEGPYFITTVGE
jgi:hypothetical protein